MDHSGAELTSATFGSDPRLSAQIRGCLSENPLLRLRDWIVCGRRPIRVGVQRS